MVVYLVVFFLTNIIALIGEKELKKNKKIGILLLILSVLPIAILGGLRVPELGWDVKKYGISMFNNVKGLNINGLINYIKIRGHEEGFVILVFLLSKLRSNLNFVLFGLQLISIYSALYYLFVNREKGSIVFGLVLYECVLYPITYSTLRQCVSLALTLIMCIKFIDKKYIQAILLFIISLFFHDSAFVAIFLFFIMAFNDSNKISSKNKVIINVILFLSLVFSTLYYEEIIKFLWNLKIIPDKYYLYINSKYNIDSLKIRWPFIILKIFNIFLGWLYFKNKSIDIKEKQENKKWFLMLLIDFVISILSIKLLNIHRITYYLFFPALFAFIPQTMKIFGKEKNNVALAYIFVCLVYLLYFITSLGYYSIYPYRGIIF